MTIFNGKIYDKTLLLNKCNSKIINIMDYNTKSNNSVIVMAVVSLLVVCLFIAIASLVFVYSRYNEMKSQNDLLINEKQQIQEEVIDAENKIDELEKGSDMNNITDYFPLSRVSQTNSGLKRIGQSYTPTEDTYVTKITLKANYAVGKNAMLNIQQTDDVLDVSKENILTQGTIYLADVVKEEYFDVLLATPVQLKQDVNYFMWIEVPDDKTEIGIAYLKEDVVDNGNLYFYNRLIGGNGNILNEELSWQVDKGADLVFGL